MIRSKFPKKNILLAITFISLAIWGLSKIDKDSIKSQVEVIKQINNEDTKYVYPLGNIVGLKAKTEGVLVIGYEDKSSYYIGGIQVGDNIIKINNTYVNSNDDVENVLNNIKDSEVEITFKRGDKIKKENIKIKYEDGQTKLGLWIRDKISGVGTMTFYDPQNRSFKGIGHGITDVDTKKLLDIKSGYIYNSKETEIVKSSNNTIGYIKCNYDIESPIGSFGINSGFGISGNLDGKLIKNNQLIKVGKREDIKLGKAHILFEDEFNNITMYDINIESIIKNDKSDRNMIIEITDKDLLNYTGGIIQGMSGAPIIQDNKIIGALTHVFKTNSKKGYGIFIDQMIELDSRY